MVALARAFVGEVLGQLFNTDGASIASDLWCVEVLQRLRSVACKLAIDGAVILIWHGVLLQGETLPPVICYRVSGRVEAGEFNALFCIAG